MLSRRGTRVSPGLSRATLTSFVLLSCVLLAIPGYAQAPAKSAPPDPLQQHYDAARTFELGGDHDRAAGEYKLFLAGALLRVANAHASAGDLEKANVYLEEALASAPGDSALHLSQATVFARQGNLPQAAAALETVLQSDPSNISAHYLLGSILYSQKNYTAAKDHLEKVVVAKPSFDVGYRLGLTYIQLHDLARARLLFDEMVTGLGDSPRIHMLFGRAYAEGEYAEEAIAEYRKALSRDPKVSQGHYFVAMAILERDGEAGFDQAVQEFQAELRNVPDDFRSHYALGFIAFKQHKPEDAVKELKKACDLDSSNPDPLIFLGEAYDAAGQDADAEVAMRKAIDLTKDVSRNMYQVNRAHYVLGRLLVRQGKRAEGEKELKTSAQMRELIRPEGERTGKLPEAVSLAEKSPALPVVPDPPQLSPGEAGKIKDAVEPLKAAIADAYNNLGVAAAGRNDFLAAADLFRRAQQWNPKLETIDRNLGMAAFYAKRYDEATVPLERHLAGHVDDFRARAALGLSYFSQDNYAKTVDALRPAESDVDADPGLSYAYAVSLVKTGQYEPGIARLKTLEQSADSAELHVMLADTYGEQKFYDKAIEEYRKAIAIDASQSRPFFMLGLALVYAGRPSEAAEALRTSLKLDPSSTSSKYHLGFVLTQMHQNEEAAKLLQEVIRQDPSHADAYYQLGKLQLESGDSANAISSLEKSAQLSPDSDYIHYQLALAYRRASRADDAAREMTLYQSLKERRRGSHEPAQPN